MNRMTTLLISCCLLAPAGLTGCDADTDDGAGTEYREQLDAAELFLEDVTDMQFEGTVVEATFEAGVDEGYYDVVAYADGEEITYMVGSRRGDILDETRTRDEQRREDADRINVARIRLARLVRQVREERPNERATRVRLDRDEVEIRTMDREGRVAHHRRRLAAAEEDG